MTTAMIEKPATPTPERAAQTFENHTEKLEDEILAILEMRMKGIHKALKEDPDKRLTGVDMRVLLTLRKLSRERAEKLRAYADAESGVSRGEKLDAYAGLPVKDMPSRSQRRKRLRKGA